jgi:DNA mismatch endonuclease (patch repair protein)
MKVKCVRLRAPRASSAAVRRVMQANLPRDTGPELALRQALHAAGFRFRKDYRPERSQRCKADVVFPRKKLCIFVDGCFWHRCPIHFELPKTNAAWWDEKIEATVERDHRQTHSLTSNGWTVIRVWEHDVVTRALRRIVAMVAKYLRRVSTPGHRELRRTSAAGAQHTSTAVPRGARPVCRRK